MLVEYEVFLDELVSELVAKNKKTRKTDNPAINELFASVQENPRTAYDNRSKLKMAEIISHEHFGIAPAALHTGAEMLQRKYKEKLNTLLHG